MLVHDDEAFRAAVGSPSFATAEERHLLDFPVERLFGGSCELSPLQVAVTSGVSDRLSASWATKLLAAGASPSRCSKSLPRTPLSLSLERRLFATADALVDGGADVCAAALESGSLRLSAPGAVEAAAWCYRRASAQHRDPALRRAASVAACELRACLAFRAELTRDLDRRETERVLCDAGLALLLLRRLSCADDGRPAAPLLAGTAEEQALLARLPAAPNLVRAIASAATGSGAWQPASHALFPPDFRAAVRSLLLVTRARGVEVNNGGPRTTLERGVVEIVVAHLADMFLTGLCPEGESAAKLP